MDSLTRMGCLVRVVDNLSSGRLENIRDQLNAGNLEFIRGDLKDPSVAEKVVDDVEAVFHLAANPQVRVAEIDPSIPFHENLLTTFHILEAMRKSETVKLIAFFSSSTVCGEPDKFPTPEDYGPLLPISVYGATNLGCESLIDRSNSEEAVRLCCREVLHPDHTEV